MRFEPVKTIQKKSSLIPIIVILVTLIFGFALAVLAESKGNTARQKEYLKKAITQDIIYAYTTTGQYPDTLEFIETTYGLTYDKDKFYIDYRALGRNVYPKVTILEK